MRQRIFILINEYFLNVLSNNEIQDLTDRLNQSVFEFEEEISDVSKVLESFPSKAVQEEKDSVLLEMIELMENTPSTASRLYRFFMNERQDPEVFMKLINQNRENLSDDHFEKIMSKAKEVYDPTFFDFISDYDF